MKSKFLKRILISLLLIFLFFCLLMLAPRTIGFLYPEKPPIGYHFESLNYLAVGIGLEKLVDLNPEIFIHGGGWKGGKRSDYMTYLVSFAEKGYMTATVSYRLKRDSIYPASVEDVSDAVEWVLKNGENFGYDSQRVALIGGSAGAHLSMLTAYGWRDLQLQMDSSLNTNRIKAVVDIYGPVDLTGEYAQNQSLVTGFIGHLYSQSPDLYKEASPITYLNKDNSPTLILHGTSDKLVPITESDILKSRLDELGVPNEYYKLPFWPHSMDIAKRYLNKLSRI